LGATKGRARVLIVEDNAPLRKLMADTLKVEGYAVSEAFDASSMREYMCAGRPEKDPGEFFDLLITDIQMPEENGITSLAILRSKGCNVPAVVVTAFPELASHERANELQATLLPKPFTLAEFRSVAAAVLQHSRTFDGQLPPWRETHVARRAYRPRT
jgi:two-component system response regulator TctD